MSIVLIGRSRLGRRWRPPDRRRWSSDALDSLSLVCLEERCHEESLRYYRHETNDGRYGYQLFQRAIVGRDQEAWGAVVRIYGGQLVRWARGHRLYAQAGEEAEALANRALENLWRRIGPDSFDAFPNLNSILGYLQRSIANLVIDNARSQAREAQRAQALRQALVGRGVATPQGRALDQVRAGEIWALVQAHCRSPREEQVAYCYLLLGLKPSDILALQPEVFGDTAAINAMLATLLKRLRRSPTMRNERLALAAGSLSEET